MVYGMGGRGKIVINNLPWVGKKLYLCSLIKTANFSNLTKLRRSISGELLELSHNKRIGMVRFTHLHVHSHYSMLDGMSKVPDLVKKAKKDGMYAMALTDHGNMFGIKDFLDTVNKENGKVKDKIKELEAKIKAVESEHTPQSLRDSSPNLGEQPDGANLGEQPDGANLGEQPDGAN